MGKAYLNENLVYICTYLLHLCAITCLHDSEVDQSKVRKKIITNTRTTELIGVYDADATIIGEISYWIGARLGIRHCSLCDITHSLFRKRSEWQDEADRLKKDSGIEFKAFHRDDQPADVKKVIAGTYPAVVARSEINQLHVFMNEAEISACGQSPEKFMKAIREKLTK